MILNGFFLFSDIVGYILVPFLRGTELLDVMQYIGMALLTVLIPLGIAVLDKEKDKVLERYIVLDHIVDIRYFSLAIVGLIIPILLWEYMGDIFGKSIGDAIHWILFYLWAISIWEIYKIMVRVYGWLKKKDTSQYIDYLKKMRGYDDMLVIWGKVWSRQEEDWHNESKSFAIFSTNVDSLFQKKKYEVLINILRTFEQYVVNRNLFLLTGLETVFPKILEWHYKSWGLEYGWLAEDRENEKDYIEYGLYSELSRTLDGIIKKIEERVLLEGESFGFFQNSSEHADKYGKEYKKKSEKTYYYLESLHLQRCFFENIDKSQESYDIEKHHFPEDWKILIENISKNIESGGLPAGVWFHEFMVWARERINNPKEEYDNHLDKVIGILFPGIHTIYFPYILAFVVRSWFDNKRMESLIDNSINFGGYYHYPLLDAAEKTEEDLDKEREIDWENSKKRTISLSAKLFRGSFMGIEKYIQELMDLEEKYKNDNKKEYLRKELLDIFQKIHSEIL